MRKQRFKGWVWFNATMWLEDPSLNACSLETRGFWLECLMWMWQDGREVLDGDIGGLIRLTGSFDGQFERCLKELVANGVTTVERKKSWLSISGGKWVNMRRSRFIPKAVKEKVLSVGRCKYCGATDSLEVDHIQAFGLGGTHDPKNLQCLCATCNQRKRMKSVKAFLGELRNG